MRTAFRILARRIRPESRNRFPVTVRPTQADVAIAHAIAYAIEQPSSVDVNEIVIRPTVQDF